jgi:hypothetical protein
MAPGWGERRIDLGARLGPALTAYIGVTTRGVRASHRLTAVTWMFSVEAKGLEPSNLLTASL